MRKISLALLLAALSGCAAVSAPVAEVDPFIGVDGGGAVFPGAVVPFGLVSLSPDTVAPQETSGYRSNQAVLGLSHNHSSGTGGTARYGNLLVAPQTGPLDLAVLTVGQAIRDEVATAGYYSARFAASGVKVEATAAARSGVHRYTDAGTMSAWYVFAAMGFYPNTGQDLYLLASPTFERISLQLGSSGKRLVIRAPGLSAVNKYVQSATLNGRPWQQAWFRHSDIAGGAELLLQMGPEPSAWGRDLSPPSPGATLPR